MKTIVLSFVPLGKGTTRIFAAGGPRWVRAGTPALTVKACQAFTYSREGILSAITSHETPAGHTAVG